MRLAALGPIRLGRPGPDGTTGLDVVRRLSQHLADLAADAEGGPRRPVPELAPHAYGDMVTVLLGDVLATGDAQAVAAATAALTATRRALP